MDAAMTTTGRERRALTPLDKLALGMLLGVALVSLFWHAAVARSLFPPIGAIGAVGSCAVLAFARTGLRAGWVLGAVWCGLLLAVEIPPATVYLVHPGSTSNFIVHALELPLLLVGFLASIGAAARHNRVDR